MLEIILWWAVLTALELMLISAVDRYELIVAVGLGLVAAVVASFARSAQPTSWRPRARMLAWLPMLPVPIVVDTVGVLVAAAKGGTGQWRETPLAKAAGDDAVSRGVRALGAIALSACPGTVVADVDEGSGVARLHVLGGTSASALERAMSR